VPLLIGDLLEPVTFVLLATSSIAGNSHSNVV